MLFKTVSLTGVISETDIDIIRQLREEVELAEKHKDECQSRMDAICQQYFPEQMKNLQTIPGIKGRSATSIIAEVGTDMSSFEDAAHLVSWCGLKPRNEENYEYLEMNGIDGYVKYPLFHTELKRKTLKNPFLPEHLHYNAEDDYFVCPMGQHMTYVGDKVRTSDLGYRSYSKLYRAQNCEGAADQRERPVS